MKIYLAGCESEGSKQVINERKIKNGFVSYYYLREHKTNKMKWLKDNIENIIVDSGAHSFFSQSEEIKSASVVKMKKRKEDPEKYFSNYLEWLIENYNYYNYFVELDIGEIITQKRVNEWRQILKDNRIFDKCITVYHPNVFCISGKQLILLGFSCRASLK